MMDSGCSRRYAPTFQTNRLSTNFKQACLSNSLPLLSALRYMYLHVEVFGYSSGIKEQCIRHCWLHEHLCSAVSLETDAQFMYTLVGVQ